MLVYGSKQCPDTVTCLTALHAAGTPSVFRDPAELSALKEFLKYRDTLDDSSVCRYYLLYGGGGCVGITGLCRCAEDSACLEYPTLIF